MNVLNKPAIGPRRLGPHAGGAGQGVVGLDSGHEPLERPARLGPAPGEVSHEAGAVGPQLVMLEVFETTP